MKRIFSSILLAAGAVLPWSAPAAAHPHVWVTGAANLQFADNKLSRVGMRWQFDGFFSQVLLGDFDTSKDGTLDDAERAAMKEQVFTSLKEFGYFTHLSVDGKETTFDRVENFTTSVDKGELVFMFDLVPAAPLDISAETQLSVYDPSIYVDIILGGDKPVTLSGIADGKCNWTFASGDEISNADGMVTPQLVKLACKA
jgi:ABC-type uncharacterized transport system substrate-binding protein